MENEVLGFLLENKSKIISAGQALKIGKYFVSNLSNHGEERLERTLKQMSKYINKKDKEDTWRNDWFAENDVSNKRIPLRLLEKTVKEIINDSEERKSEYITKFWVNICLTSNSDIDESTAFLYLETIESLSCQQLCIIRLIFLKIDREVDSCSIDDVEQMAKDQQTKFYSISRDYETLMDKHFIEKAPSVLRIGENPFLGNPSYGLLPDYMLRLYSLMNLDDIPNEDIVKTFSPWNVRLKN